MVQPGHEPLLAAVAVGLLAVASAPGARGIARWIEVDPGRRPRRSGSIGSSAVLLLAAELGTALVLTRLAWRLAGARARPRGRPAG